MGYQFSKIVIALVVLPMTIIAPAAFASGPSYVHCNSAHTEAKSQVEQVRNQARQEAQSARTVFESQGQTVAAYNASQPHWQESSRLHSEASALLLQANQERSRCSQEVRARKRREAAERRTQSRQLARDMMRQGGNEITGGLKYAGKSYLSKKFLSEKSRKKISLYRKAKRRGNMLSDLRKLGSGKQTWREKYGSIFNLGNSLTREVSAAKSKYSLAHAMSGKLTQMSLARLKVVHLNALDEFKQSMNAFNQEYSDKLAQQQAEIEAARQARAAAALAKREAELRAQNREWEEWQRQQGAQNTSPSQPDDGCLLWIEQEGLEPACGRWVPGSKYEPPNWKY